MGKKLNRIAVLDYAAEGKCISKVEGKALFTKKTAPGDVVDVFITRKRKGFLEGKVIEYHERSEDRIEPFCKHYDHCGGCQWQHVPYSKQLAFKEEQVKYVLERIGGLELPQMEEIIGSEKQIAYRNKLEYSFANKRWLLPEEISNKDIKRDAALGYHIAGSFDKVLNIEQCHLQEDLNDAIRNRTKELAIELGISFYDLKEKHGGLRTITLRNNRRGEWMLIFQIGTAFEEKYEALFNALIEEFSQIHSLFYVLNEKVNDTFLDLETIHFHGKQELKESIGELEFSIKPKSFFQTNPWQAEVLYQKALEFCGGLENKTVYDLYTGTGTIALFLAKKAKKVIGVESVQQAIDDAEENAKANGIDNAVFHCADMKDILRPEFFEKNGRPDIIVCDPPRDGMHKRVVEEIIKTEVPTIVYISCKPSTQARDLEIFAEKYEVKKVQPVDMFPHTHHIENVVLLERKLG